MKSKRVSCVIFALCAAQALGLEKSESRVVNTNSGYVRGYKEDGVYTFYSIPYATAPRGADKFKAPLPAPMWLDTFEAVDKGIICPQASLFPFPNKEMKEDCLIANVYVPDTEKTKLPVVVYVHGGAYQMGFGRLITPKTLVRSKKIIAVTFNYRLGVHGFLCLGTKDAPGNAGMKDQVGLLRWVRKNIATFGGNPDDVTIAGCSAGSSAVDLLMLSKSARGLFNKVIPESGASLATWSVQIDPLENAKEFARSQNFTNVDDTYALEEFYKTASSEQLTSDMFMARPDSTFVFTPCVERQTETEMFLNDAPINILKSGKYPKVPMLYGFANMEGLFRVGFGYDLFKDKMNKKFSDFLPADLRFDSDEQKEQVANQVKKFYFGEKPVGDDTIFAYIDYFSDVIFTYATLRAVRYHTEAGNNQVYLYQYSFPQEQNFGMPESIRTKIVGSNHCAQMMAVMDPMPASAWVPPENSSEEFIKSRNTIRELWLNFMTTGQPVPPGSALPEWPATQGSGAPYMELGVPPAQLQTDVLLERRVRFWDDIYDKHYRTPVAPPSPSTHEDL